MFKRGFTLPNVLALILGLCAAVYLAQAKRTTVPEATSAAGSAQPSE